jgi:hypothetical protein
LKWDETAYKSRDLFHEVDLARITGRSDIHSTRSCHLIRLEKGVSRGMNPLTANGILQPGCKASLTNSPISRAKVRSSKCPLALCRLNSYTLLNSSVVRVLPWWPMIVYWIDIFGIVAESGVMAMRWLCHKAPKLYSPVSSAQREDALKT